MCHSNSFYFQHAAKAFSLESLFDFGLSSSSDKIEWEENQEGINIASPYLKTFLNDDQENHTLGDQNNDIKGHEDDKKYDSSTSETGSSDENIADPFAILEL